MASSSNAAPDLGTIRVTEGVEVPNIRSLDDFLLDKARFESPPMNDVARWNNRIISNLLYYQTNYFAFFGAFFVLASFFNAQDFCLGLAAVVAMGGVFYFALAPFSQFINTRQEHPLATFGAIGVVVYFTYYVFSSVLVLLFCLLLPCLFVLIHASTRLRNFKAKINQQAERLGLKQTLMGRILEVAGADVKA